MGRLHRLFMITSDFHYAREGRVYTTSAFMRFVPELLAFADSIKVAAPVHLDPRSSGFSVESARLGYLPLPPSATLEQFLRRFPRDSARIARTLYGGIRRADLVWINGPHPLLVLGAVMARALGKPYVLWMRGDIRATVPSKYHGDDRTSTMARRAAVYLDEAMLSCAEGAVVFYTGSGLARYGTRARYALPANTSLVRAAQLAKAPHGDLHDPVRILWAGQLRPVKGVSHLLEALRLLRDSGRRVTLEVIGDGEQRTELEQEIRRLELEADVMMRGYIPPGAALTEAFANADIYVLPSLSEGIPKVLIEATAQGLPVVGSRVGGVPDVITDGVNGLLVEPGSREAIRAAVETIIDDDALRRRLAAGALEYAKMHTAEAEVERIWSGIREAYPSLR